jgi:hypothetical protein
MRYIMLIAYGFLDRRGIHPVADTFSRVGREALR